jgi:hypothetical protein
MFDWILYYYTIVTKHNWMDHIKFRYSNFFFVKFIAFVYFGPKNINFYLSVYVYIFFSVYHVATVGIPVWHCNAVFLASPCQNIYVPSINMSTFHNLIFWLHLGHVCVDSVWTLNKYIDSFTGSIILFNCGIWGPNVSGYCRVIKKSLCTWWLQYTKLQVMIKLSPASLRTFIDARLTLTPSVIPNSNFVITVSDWYCLKYFCVLFMS